MRLYSLSEIEQGRFPKRIDFQWAATEFGLLLSNRELFVGGMLSGSASQNVATTLSDLDGVVVFRHHKAMEARQEFSVFTGRLRQRFINYEDLMLVDETLWRSRDHTVTPGYLNHLKQCKSNQPEHCHGEPILVQLGSPRITSEQSSLIYLAHKLRKLENLMTWSDEVWSNSWLELAMEIATTPKYSLLRLIECRGGRTDTSSKEREIETILLYLRMYVGGVESDRASELIGRVAEIRPRIINGLDAIVHDNDPTDYRLAIESLIGLAPLAIDTLSWIRVELSELADSL